MRKVLHTILDLPCLSAALEQQQAGVAEATRNASPLAGAFFQYILREEGGLGGTIDKLGGMHSLFEGAAKQARVKTVAQITPILLRSYFLTISTEASYDLVLQVVSVMLERISTLYAIETFRADIRKVFATQMIVLFQAHPKLIVDLNKELLDYVGNRRNVGQGKEEFFVHIVWVIGEFAGPTLDPRCTPEIIDQYHEVRCQAKLLPCLFPVLNCLSAIEEMQL